MNLSTEGASVTSDTPTPAPTAARAERLFREAVAFVREEYGDEADIRYPEFVLAYVTARVAGGGAD
jgi:hypothetical protein